MLKSLFVTLLMLTTGLIQAQTTVTPPTLEPAQQEQIRKAVGSTVRSINNVMRDAARNPEPTLTFFAVAPQHTVIEIWPGSGWYTEILAPLLHDEGQLIAAHFSPDSDSDYQRKSLEQFKAKLADQPDVYGEVELSALDYDPSQQLAQPASADRVLVFRNVHNWLAEGRDETALMFAKMYAALKPGGMLGLVEHRARIGTDLDTMISSGYVTEELVLELAKEAGFELLSRSPVNQNAQDTTQHPEGVWTLPPTLRLGDQDRAQYLAIGESDRMTLLFVK